MNFFNKLFGSNEKKKEREAKAAMHRVFDHALQLLNDDTKQNALMPEGLQQAMLRGGVCDTLAAAKGPFGRTPENPIPVNGPLGEITYLSRLITAGNGQRVGFHRLGSMKAIDVYEVVSTDGESWDILFFDYYHAGKSKKVPDGYAFSSRVEGVTGTNRFNTCFPSQLRDHAIRCSSAALGVPMPHPELKVFESKKISRPKKHAEFFYAALDLICAANRQLSLEKRFAELDKRIEEEEYDTEKFLARDVIRQALIFVSSPAVAWVRMEPVMPVFYRNDRTCLELCCAMCAMLYSAFDNDKIYIRQEILFHLYRDLYGFFSGYTKEFFDYMRSRVDFYREKLAQADPMELSFALVSNIFDANKTPKDDRDDHIETFISPVAFLMTNMDLLIKNVRSYIETEFLPCRQEFDFQAADSVLLDLRDTLAGFFQKEFGHELDDERIAAFADTFPVLVFNADSFYTPSNRIFASSYIDGKLMAFLDKKCLFPEVLSFCDNLSDYAALFWSAFDVEILYLEYPDFIDFDDFVTELSEGEITELSDLEVDKLRLIFCSAANAVAAVFALPGKITLDFSAEDLAGHEADLHEPVIPSPQK